MHHVPCINELFHIRQWGHAIWMNESCLIHQCVMSYIRITQMSDTFMSVYVRHVNKSCHIHEWEWRDSCEWVTSYTSMRHAIYVNESCHIHPWVMSYIWMSHLTYMNASCSYTNESCHIHKYVMSHIMNESYHIHQCVMSYIWMSHVTYINESCHTYEWVVPRTCMCDVIYMNDLCHIILWRSCVM